MAGSPSYKVYDSQGVYQAACKEAYAAAVLADLYGGTVRTGHAKRWTVWRSEWWDRCDPEVDWNCDTIQQRMAEEEEEIRARCIAERGYV